MCRHPWRGLTVLAVTAALGTPAVAAADPAANAAIAGTAAPAGLTAVGAVPGDQQLTFDLWLTSDTAKAQAFADAVSTPGGQSYHQYLSPDDYTARFGPSETEASSVASWLLSQGFSDVQSSGQRDYVSATGSVAQIDQAFAVQMTQYRSTDSAGHQQTVEANAGDISVPSSLAGDVSAVTGLNSSPPQPQDATSFPRQRDYPCSTYWGQRLKTIQPAYDGENQYPYAGCGYSADQMRAAYELTDANTGAGQTIAFVEVGTPPQMFQSLVDYAKSNDLSAPTSSQYREEAIGRGNACGDQYYGEQQEDSEAAYAIAPSADQLMVGGDSCDKGDQGLLDGIATVLGGNGDSPQADVVSNSYGLADTQESGVPAAELSTVHALLLRAAGEGVGMYFASGDDPGVYSPASDPYATAVGGTSLGIGAQNQRLFETGWSTGTAVKRDGGWTEDPLVGLGAGGGASSVYSQPSYQAGVVPSSMSTLSSNGQLDRTVPDIAADADEQTPFLAGEFPSPGTTAPDHYETTAVAGTSLATPLVAAMVIDAQQGQATSFGFIDPLIYSLAGSSAFHDILPFDKSSPPQYAVAFDPKGLYDPEALLALQDTQGLSNTTQVTAPGYDTVTGLGTPNGAAFISALRSRR